MSYLELLDEQTLVIFGCGGGERLTKDTNMDFQRTFLINRAMREGGDSCKSIVNTHPKSQVSQALKMIVVEVGFQARYFWQRSNSEIAPIFVVN